ncbi:hypothetical protein [Caldifermentibacillus hisashii]|uniref:hypothetical protein n=1 Tax=Caldifermentibacillus hisashii TaxID=996558 RepID=UPI0022B97A93|nr:hypothetical protein [Caldifermentibacillus hisashii]
MEQLAEQTTFISPFSYYHHNWELSWKRVPSNKKYDVPYENRNEKEERALEAIATVGVIGGLQLKNLFRIGNDKLKKMCNKHLVERHSLYKDGKEIPIYTVGKYGANKIMPEYEENYWVEMDTVKVLKCISFFQFCYLFDQVDILPAPEPFTAGIRLKDVPFYVYVDRNGMKDLTMFLKWKKNFNERIFIITESLDYVQELNMFMETKPIKLRVILDEQLKYREFELYHYEADHPKKWVKG